MWTGGGRVEKKVADKIAEVKQGEESTPITMLRPVTPVRLSSPLISLALHFSTVDRAERSSWVGKTVGPFVKISETAQLLGAGWLSHVHQT